MRAKASAGVLGKMLLACAGVCAFVALPSCSGKVEREAAALVGGDPAKGRAAIGRYGCSSCHTIPGIKGANALVGPPLTQIASRTYLGGVLENTPGNMIRWIQDPRGVDEKTAMPNLGVTDTDARDIASYLYTLR